MIVAALLFAGLLWEFLFQATDPNYPERLLRGRLLFMFEALLIYVGNLWLLMRLRQT